MTEHRVGAASPGAPKELSSSRFGDVFCSNVWGPCDARILSRPDLAKVHAADAMGMATTPAPKVVAAIAIAKPARLRTFTRNHFSGTAVPGHPFVEGPCWAQETL